MVISKNRSALYAALLASLWGCNIEVGNPDGDAPSLMGRSVQNLSFSMKNATTCETTASPCASAPVLIDGEASGNLAFEMRKVELGLAGTTLKPFAEEGTITAIDLMAGTTVKLSEPHDATEITAIAVRFGGVQDTSMRISGTLTGTLTGNRIALPMDILYRDSFTSEALISDGQSGIEGLVFDASMWFDFTSTAGSTPWTKVLTDGVCQNWEAGGCLKYRESLARQISQKVARSMSVKKNSPASGKSSNRNLSK